MTIKIKAVLPTAAALAFCSASVWAAAPAPVTVSGGTVNFTGRIVDAACSLDTGASETIVNLGEVRAAALAKKGATSTPVSFSIKLSDCVLASSDTTTDSYSTAAVTFVGTPVGSDNTVLALNGGDGAVGVAAANVGIQILQDAEPVAIAGSQSSAAKPIVAGENTLYFGAQYVATAAGATAGAANSSLTFNLTYE